MYLDYSGKLTVKVSIIRYLYIFLQEFPENLGVTSATPAADRPFKVKNDSKTQYLPEDKAQNFHHTVAQLMFVIDRELRDMQK